MVQFRMSSEQAKAVLFMRMHNRLLVVHSTGSGKTVIAKKVISDHLKKYPRDRVLCVTPVSVSEQFMNKTQPGPNKRDRVTYIGYEKFAKIINYTNLKHYLIIFDEVHYLKNPDAKFLQGSQRYNKLKEAHKVLMMTATPISTKVDNLRVYAEIIKGEHINTPITIQNIPNYFRKKVSVFIRSPTNSNFPRREVNKVENFNLNNNEAYNYIKNPKHKIGYIVKKFNAFLENIKNQRKVVAFFEHIHSARLFSQFLHSHGVGYSIIHGGSRERKSIMNNFTSNNSKKVMILTRAGEAGLDFKRLTQIHFMEMPLSYVTYTQVVGRAIRRAGPMNRVPSIQVFFYKLKIPKLNSLFFERHLNIKKPKSERYRHITNNNSQYAIIKSHESQAEKVLQILKSVSITGSDTPNTSPSSNKTTPNYTLFSPRNEPKRRSTGTKQRRRDLEEFHTQPERPSSRGPRVSLYSRGAVTRTRNPRHVFTSMVPT